ncbi:cation-translocating P-type ATPase [Candidatus Zixiibacteriota bacterium]
MSVTGKHIDKPWAQDTADVLSLLAVSQEKGLERTAVQSRLVEYGRNRLREIKRQSSWSVLISQFKSLIVGLLALASGVSFAFGELVEGLAILAVIAINAAIGFFTELRAVRSMEALRKMGTVKTKVRRDGEVREVEAELLVPGDVVILEGGDIINADLRLLQASKLQADESTLTGESVPVSKAIDPLDESTPLAERANMLFKGTALTRGSGEAMVVATGMKTELGQISSLVEEAEEESTPLEKRLNQLGHKLIWATLVVVVLVAGAGILAGKETFLMIETAIALAVAAIPEGLPIVATIALAKGMRRMAMRNALINRLSAVETLGATNIIFTDKTGTLTENRMTVTLIARPSGEVVVEQEESSPGKPFSQEGTALNVADDQALQAILETSVLCNNASLQETEGVGDPLEIALLAAAAKADILRPEMTDQWEEVREEAFDSDLKMMATFHLKENSYRLSVKGAPEPVLEACGRILTDGGEQDITQQERHKWLEENDRMAHEGLRVLALATRNVSSADEQPYQDLVFLGLMGLQDPPREQVRPAIERCHEAGVRVIMVTGDQPVTARNIALSVGLVGEGQDEVLHGRDLKPSQGLSNGDRQKILQTSIFARVSPKQKLDLIDIHQKNGSVVAMTGDGVNDAPALKEANIGVAMGLRGTQVAREAADMVLKDDAFSSIVAAIEQGRVIFDNIRKFVRYLISCNVSEIMAVALASMANAPLPILPLQILFLNLVTDVFPALALGVGEGDPEVMRRPSRDARESILHRRHWLGIGGYSLVLTSAVLGALAIALLWLKMDYHRAVTISFLTMAFSQLWHVFNMRDRGSRLLRNEITQNPFVWAALAMCSGLLLASVYLPGLSDVLKLTHPGAKGWAVVAVMSLIPLIIGQLATAMKPATRTRGGSTLRLSGRSKPSSRCRARCR